jgi:predicted RNA-binding protein with TRAM domain
MESPAPHCLFTGRIERRDGDYVVVVPNQEVDIGTLESDGVYRFEVVPAADGTTETTDDATPSSRATGASPVPTTPSAATAQSASAADDSADSSASSQHPPRPTRATETDDASDGPPVTEGETRRLEIEDIGDQGDGLARVGPGYVVFVPDTEIGQQPLVRITTVRENVAFGEVVKA